MGHEYDEQRLSAIETTDKNVQIIACAGSGKTDIVSQRVAHILKSHPHIKPSNIVAFTYTEKAAEELRTRIYKKIKDQIGQVSGLAEMYIGTIHAFCLRILQEYIMEYQKYDVLDEVQTKIFIDKNYAAIGMKNLDMERYKETDIFMTLMTILRESEVERENDTYPLY